MLVHDEKVDDGNYRNEMILLQDYLKKKFQ
jgi:hypothetical protein